MTKDMLEMAKVCVKWLKFLRNGLNMFEMTQRFRKFLKYLGEGLDIWCQP